MSSPFIAEVRIISWNFPPKGWAFCNGQLLPINQNQALFSLLGTTFGGNGQTTFALPDFRGRMPMHQGNGYVLGQHGGEELHTLTQSEIPAHNHLVNAALGTTTKPSTVTNKPSGKLPAIATVEAYAPPSATTTLAPQAVSNVGGSQAHENRQPSLVLNFIVALQGIFPSQN